MRFPLPHNATVIALILRIGLPALGVCLGCAPRLAQAQEFCQSCEVQVSLGERTTTGAPPAAWSCQCP